MQKDAKGYWGSTFVRYLSKKLIWGLFFLLPQAVFSDSLVYPVFADGWVVAGNKSVGEAIRLMRIGMWFEAQEELHKSVGYRPRNHAAQFNLGICYERSGNSEIARQYYERAIDLRPEVLYCEGLARLDRESGNGAEFIKFLILCDTVCNHGYAFARAGLWKRAIQRFESVFNHKPTAVIALNLAVAHEVLGNRRDARRFILHASSLENSQQYQFFYHHLSTSSDLPLEMLTSLPGLTSVTEMEVLETLIVNTDNVSLRADNTHDSPILMLLSKGTHVDVLSFSPAWVRIRTPRQKEGYLPALFLSSRPSKKNEGFTDYSRDYSVSRTDLSKKPENLDSTMYSDFLSSKTGEVISDGTRVALRDKPSLLAEIVKYMECGTIIEVRDSDLPSWFEVVDSSPDKTYILKMHVQILGTD
jgi:uncharacterized protein YgiM (DUF1202 family)